jgi:hypothetical protein
MFNSFSFIKPFEMASTQVCNADSAENSQKILRMVEAYLLVQ